MKESLHACAIWQRRYQLEIQRHKGLGEMNPRNRTDFQATIEDAVEADKTFEMLMGS